MHRVEKSDSSVVPVKLANKPVQAGAELVEGRGGTEGNAGLQSTIRTQSRAVVSQAQERIRKAVNRNKKEKLTALLHHVTVDFLRAAFLALKKRAVAGIDQITWEQYAEGLEPRLADLHRRLHAGSYRALPARRAFIPKADGKQRPLGIAAMEDKIVQAAMVMLLTPIYEAEFLGFSYGFRPGRSQHDALDALAYGIKGRYIWWILDADIRSFFDSISHEWLIRFVEHRIGDPRIIRLIRKWLRAGVLEQGVWKDTVQGTPQGAVISPLLANIYLHYAYDLWAQAWRKRHVTGDMIIVRYADDTIVGFQHRQQAEQFLSDLRERLAKFALDLHPEKTRLIEFGRFAAERRAKRGEGKPETFDFLGFTHICAVKREDRSFQLRRKTMCKRKQAFVNEVSETLRRHRHAPIDEQGRWLSKVLRGYYMYFSVPTNLSSVRAVRHQIKIRWFHNLQRRSQRKLKWRRMNAIAARYLPVPILLHPWPEKRFLVKHPK